MDALCVSCNEDVSGIEIRMMDARPRQARNHLGGASYCLTACVSADPSTRAAGSPNSTSARGRA